MRPFYKFLTLIGFVGLIALGGKALSTFFSSTPNFPELHRSNSNPKPIIQDSSTTNWKIAVLDSFARKYQGAPKWSKSKSKKAGSKNTWILKLPRGLSFVQYALSFQEIAESHYANVEYGEIKGKKRNHLYLKLTKGRDSLKIRARWSNQILPKVAKLAIVIDRLDSIGTEELIFLSNRNWKPTCIVNNKTQNKSLRKYLIGFPKTEVVLELPLEPLHYPYRNPGPGAILLHHSQSQIYETLDKKKVLFPKAIGFASTYGGRAIENKPTMEKVFRYHKENQLIFLDRTQSKRSLTPSLARKMGVTAFETQNQFLTKNVQEFMNQKLLTAIKYGKNVLVLNYSKQLLKTLDQYFKSTSWQKQGVELVHLSELLKK